MQSKRERERERKRGRERGREREGGDVQEKRAESKLSSRRGRGGPLTRRTAISR